MHSVNNVVMTHIVRLHRVNTVRPKIRVLKLSATVIPNVHALATKNVEIIDVAQHASITRNAKRMSSVMVGHVLLSLSVELTLTALSVMQALIVKVDVALNKSHDVHPSPSISASIVTALSVKRWLS